MWEFFFVALVKNETRMLLFTGLCALPHGHRLIKWWCQWASSPLPEAILNGWMPLQSTAG